MNLESIELKDYHRLKVQDLESLLRDLPITIEGSKDLRLESYMGLGKIIYIRPLRGRISRVKCNLPIKKLDSGEGYCFFEYKEQSYDVKFY